MPVATGRYYLIASDEHVPGPVPPWPLTPGQEAEILALVRRGLLERAAREETRAAGEGGDG